MQFLFFQRVRRSINYTDGPRSNVSPPTDTIFPSVTRVTRGRGAPPPVPVPVILMPQARPDALGLGTKIDAGSVEYNARVA